MGGTGDCGCDNKAYSSQLIALYLLAMKFAFVRGKITDSEMRGYIEDLQKLPEQVELLLNNKNRIQKFANRYLAAREVFFIGRGIDYAISMEGSLKLKRFLISIQRHMLREN